ncbi:MAG: hypothetical protein ACI4TU_00445 [Candidatus Cryptobacteroides sp.]
MRSGRSPESHQVQRPLNGSAGRNVLHIVLMFIGIALLSILCQTIHAVRRNPADGIRTE